MLEDNTMLTRKILLLLVVIFALAPTAQAYSPPPAGNIFLLKKIIDDKPSIQIELPPRLIMMPDKLLFPKIGVTHSFNSQSEQFELDPPRPGPYPEHKVSVTKSGSGSPDGDYYVITVTGFKKDELPGVKDFRLTFVTTVSNKNIEDVEKYLEKNSIPTAELTGVGCAPSEYKSHICLKTITTVRASSKKLVAYLKQTIGVKGIIVPGNVAAPGLIDGFSLSPRSLAVGGNVDVSGGTKLEGYISENTTVFSWGKVESQIRAMFKKGQDLGSSISSNNFTSTNTYKSIRWNLNAPAKNTMDQTSNSFSTPPEGKIWYHNNSLTLDAPGNSGITFSGSGTIVVKGNLSINDPIKCGTLTQTRLAFLVEGDININTDSIGCGAYIAMGGKLTFSNPISGSGNMTGIFIARDSVKLPAGELKGPYIINYDSYLAAHPTALIQELLTAVFSSGS